MTEQDDKQQEQKEVGLYEKIAARTAELMEEGKKTLDEALAKAREEIAVAGDFSREQAEKMSGFIRRDIALMKEKEGLSTDVLMRALDPQRVAAGIQSVLAGIMAKTSDVLGDWAEKTEKHLEFHTGEVTSIGTLTCKGCQAELRMKGTTRIPPCPKCHQTVFRKSY
jgi:hypothetical protein